MGSWGYLPFDSDDFGDTFDEVARASSRSVDTAIGSRISKASEPQEMWTAIGLVLWAYHAGVLDDDRNVIIDRALEMCEQIRTTPVEGYRRPARVKPGEMTYADTWREPRTFKRTLDKVEEHLRDIRGRHEQPLILTCLAEMLGKGRR